MTVATYCSKPTTSLVVVFERDSEEPIRGEVADGEAALLRALKVLLQHNALRPGDRLTVQAAE